MDRNTTRNRWLKSIAGVLIAAALVLGIIAGLFASPCHHLSMPEFCNALKKEGEIRRAEGSLFAPRSPCVGESGAGG